MGGVAPQITQVKGAMCNLGEKKTERRPNDLGPCAVGICVMSINRPFNIYIATHQQGVGPA